MSEWIISSSVLIIVIVALRFILKGKISLKLQYALWALVLVRLLIPFSIGNSSISVLNFTEKMAEETPWHDVDNPGTVDDVVSPGTQGVVNNVIRPDITINTGDVKVPDTSNDFKDNTNHAVINRPTYETGTSEGLAEDNITDVSDETPVAELVDIVAIISKVAMGVWIAGMVLVGGYFIIVNVSFSVALEKDREFMDKISGYPLPVYLTRSVDTPCMNGLISPKIYVTSEAVKSRQVIKHVLEHESTHYRHGDHIWCVLRAVTLTIHWYNPLVWLAAVLSRNDAELACDEGTIKRIGEEERAEYGRTLIGLTCQKRSGLFVTATTMTGSKKSIKERIALIAKKPHMALYTLIAVLAVAVVAVGCTFTGADRGDDTVQDSSGGEDDEQPTTTPDDKQPTTSDDEVPTNNPSSGDLSYKWNIEGDTLVFSGTGAIDRGDWRNEEFKHVIINEGITSIEEDAFSNCKSLESVVMPDSIESIGNYAFRNCEKLKEITFPEKEYVKLETGIFEGTLWLSDRQAENPVVILYDEVIDGTTASGKVVIPDGIITINDSAFYNADNVEEVIIPQTVVTIDDRAFYDCDALTSVTILNRYVDINSRTAVFDACDNLKVIRGNDAANAQHYAENIGIPYEVIITYNWRIEGDALIFSGTDIVEEGDWCDKEFKHVVIGEGITEIAYRAIQHLKNIESISFPSTYKNVSGFNGFTNLREVILADGVERIDEVAFSDCTALEKIVIPDSVTQIMLWAFSGCTSLKEIVLPEKFTHFGSNVFVGTPWLESLMEVSLFAIVNGVLINVNNELAVGDIVIPDGVTYIDTTDFYGNEKITSVTIPESVTYIDGEIFASYGNPNLKVIYGKKGSYAEGYAEVIGVTFKEIEEYTWRMEGDTLIFSGTGTVEKNGWENESFKHVVIGEGITEIAYGAREYFTEIESISFPSTYKIVEGFANCSNLKEVTLSEGVEWIEECAFEGCTSLERIVIPESVTQIMLWAFAGCTNLKEVVLPEDFTRFGSEAFAGTALIEDQKKAGTFAVLNNIILDASLATGDVIIPEGITHIGDGAFYNADITSVTLPKSLEGISSKAFVGCNNLSEVIFKGAPEYISNDAFNGCNGLTEIVLPDGVKRIGVGAFSACRNLQKIVIPDSVTSIGQWAFENCVNLKEIVMSKSCFTFGADVFANTAWLEERRAENPLVVVNGVLIDGVAATGKVVIPSGVTRIAVDAFGNKMYYLGEDFKVAIEEIVIPEGVSKIDSGAFSGCYDMTKVTIPNSITSGNIGEGIFADEKNLTIYGEANSYAESYAKELGIAFEAISK